MKKRLSTVTLSLLLIAFATSFASAKVMCKQGTSFRYHAYMAGMNDVWGGWTLKKGKWRGSLTDIGHFCILIDSWGGSRRPGENLLGCGRRSLHCGNPEQ
jgi:hypothetical protein